MLTTLGFVWDFPCNGYYWCRSLDASNGPQVRHPSVFNVSLNQTINSIHCQTRMIVMFLFAAYVDLDQAQLSCRTASRKVTCAVRSRRGRGKTIHQALGEWVCFQHKCFMSATCICQWFQIRASQSMMRDLIVNVVDKCMLSAAVTPCLETMLTNSSFSLPIHRTWQWQCFQINSGRSTCPLSWQGFYFKQELVKWILRKLWLWHRALSQTEVSKNEVTTHHHYICDCRLFRVLE